MRIRRGAAILFDTRPRASPAAVAQRVQVVKVHQVLVGFEREQGPDKRTAIRWAGAGGYLREVSIEDIVEIVERSPRSTPSCGALLSDETIGAIAGAVQRGVICMICAGWMGPEDDGRACAVMLLSSAQGRQAGVRPEMLVAPAEQVSRNRSLVPRRDRPGPAASRLYGSR